MTGCRHKKNILACLLLFNDDHSFYQIFLFICVPIFIIVIIGVVNCVTQRHSTRQLHLSNDLARLIDFRHAVTAGVMLFVWMAERIVTMAVDIEAYQNDQVRHNMTDLGVDFINPFMINAKLLFSGPYFYA